MNRTDWYIALGALVVAAALVLVNGPPSTAEAGFRRAIESLLRKVF